MLYQCQKRKKTGLKQKGIQNWGRRRGKEYKYIRKRYKLKKSNFCYSFNNFHSQRRNSIQKCIYKVIFWNKIHFIKTLHDVHFRVLIILTVFVVKGKYNLFSFHYSWKVIKTLNTVASIPFHRRYQLKGFHVQ